MCVCAYVQCVYILLTYSEKNPLPPPPRFSVRLFLWACGNMCVCVSVCVCAYVRQCVCVYMCLCISGVYAYYEPYTYVTHMYRMCVHEWVVCVCGVYK